MILIKIEEYIQHIEKKDFFLAHESLEYIWFPRRFEISNEIKIIKGFINAAVSLELLKKGKEKQSIQVWNTFLKYIKLIQNSESQYTEEFINLTSFLKTYRKEYYQAGFCVQPDKF